MVHKIKNDEYGFIRKVAFEIAVAAGESIDFLLVKKNGEKHVFMRVLLTKVCLENRVSPYQVSLFLCKHFSTVYYYEKMYLVMKKLREFKKLEQKYYENAKIKSEHEVY